MNLLTLRQGVHDYVHSAEHPNLKVAVEHPIVAVRAGLKLIPIVGPLKEIGSALHATQKHLPKEARNHMRQAAILSLTTGILAVSAVDPIMASLRHNKIDAVIDLAQGAICLAIGFGANLLMARDEFRNEARHGWERLSRSGSLPEPTPSSAARSQSR